MKNSDVKNQFNNPEKIEKELVTTLEKIRENYRAKFKNQTNIKWISNQIKEDFGNIEDDFHCDVASTLHDNEWMYDLVWYHKSEVGFIDRICLVLESELSNRSNAGLLLDFNKLLLSNADLRVMICFAKGNYNTPNNVNELIDLFDNAVKSYQNLEKGSRTLILIWEDYTDDVIYPHLIIK